MTTDDRLRSDRFPRSSRYSPEWLIAGASGGANALWLTEWLTEAIDLEPGMRILDLGCGRAASSIFLHREFGVDVWATDLWFSASENLARIDDAGVGGHVFPMQCDARSLPYADAFFDAILSIDSFVYYGTDDTYLPYITRFVRPGGVLAIAGAGLLREIDGVLPSHLREWWEPAMWSLHSAAWWRRHWERSNLVTVDRADAMPDGWRAWLEWHHAIAPDNSVEIRALEEDQGAYLGYVRAVARRRLDARLDEPIRHVRTQYSRHPLLRRD
jgi:SAM-dependent methyltransferase